MQQEVERLEYIDVVQQSRDKEEHGIQMVGKSSLNRMKRSDKYWAKIYRDPHREIQEQWTRCNKHYDKINNIMKDVGLPEFGTPDNFINLSNVVKMHAKQHVLWTKEFAKISYLRIGQVQQLVQPSIRARTMLQQLNSSLLKFQVHAVDIRGIYADPMEQHIFPWAQTCE